MRMRRICKRCHRVRPVNGVGYCPTCTNDLRHDEQARPRPSKDAVEEKSPKVESTAEQESEELAEASTEPPPPQGEPEGRETVPEPAPQATAVEGGSPAAAEEEEAEPLASA